MLALSSGTAQAQLLDDLGETTDSLSRGELNVLPGTQERLRETVDRVTEPLRQIAPQPEPEPPSPPATTPAPEVPGQGVNQSAPSPPGADSSAGAGETGSPGSAGVMASRSQAVSTSDPVANGSRDRGGARPGDGGAAGAGSASGSQKRVDGGRRGPEVSRRDAVAPKLRDAIVNVIEALPSWAKAALLALTVLLLAAISYLVLTWRRLLAAERRASTDRLTGLPNRTSAEDNLGRMLALAQRSRRPMSIALFDLDHFKQINDTHGHGAGDAVLRAVGESAGAHVRGSDLVARFGGEEFVLLLPDTGVAGARAAAEKLRERIAALIIPEAPGGVSASFGVATDRGGSGQTSPSELIARADRALYAAKDAGRNRVVVDGDERRRFSPRRETVGAS